MIGSPVISRNYEAGDGVLGILDIAIVASLSSYAFSHSFPVYFRTEKGLAITRQPFGFRATMVGLFSLSGELSSHLALWSAGKGTWDSFRQRPFRASTGRSQRPLHWLSLHT